MIRREALRFLLSGAINTGATYVIYLALLPLLHYTAAYTIAYVTGIVLAYSLNTRFVFRVRHTARRLALFPLVYVVQYLLGVVALRVAIGTFDVPQKLALLASIAVTIPLTFLLSRLILKPRDAAAFTVSRRHE